MNFYHLLRQTVYFHFIWIQCDRHLHLVRLQITTNIVKRNFKLINSFTNTHSSWFMMVLQFTDWKSKKKNVYLLNCHATVTFWTTSFRLGSTHIHTKTQCNFSLSFCFISICNFCSILFHSSNNNSRCSHDKQFSQRKARISLKLFLSWFNFILCLGNCCVLENSFEPGDWKD